jgi:hypothetical protein
MRKILDPKNVSSKDHVFALNHHVMTTKNDAKTMWKTPTHSTKTGLLALQIFF